MQKWSRKSVVRASVKFLIYQKSKCTIFFRFKKYKRKAGPIYNGTLYVLSYIIFFIFWVFGKLADLYSRHKERKDPVPRLK